MKKIILALAAMTMTSACYHVPVRTGDAALNEAKPLEQMQDFVEWYSFWPYRVLAQPEGAVAAKPAPAPTKAESAAKAQAASLQNLGGGIKVEKGADGELYVVLPEEALQFAVGKAEVNDKGKAELAKLAAALKGFSGVKYTVQGFTDNAGDAALNQALSEKRAGAVKDILIADGLAASTFEAVQGLGAAQPVGDNATVEGRAKNRRVVVKLKN